MSTYFHSKQIVTDGLVFSVDAYNTKSYIGSGTTSNDLTINSNNGVLTNGVVFDTNAWSFDGVNDYIGFGDVLKNISGSNILFSVEAWVFKTTSGAGCVVSKLGENGNHTFILQFRNSGQMIFGASDDGLNIRSFFTDEAFPENIWTHAVACHDGVGDDVFLYIDGVLKSKTINQAEYASYGTVFDSTAELQLGQRDRPSLPIPLTGYISNVKIYNKVLSDSEVLQNYNATKWRFQ